MEWLRSIDLSEYAPNLRGSGVHGALMVYNVVGLIGMLYSAVTELLLLK